MLTAVVGINWGDEGKGRMVDLLSAQYDVVVRYQGGNNAGHTVVNDRGKFIFNLLPSGVLQPETVNVMGTGMVIDLEHLDKERKTLREKGVELTPAQLKISDRATICMPYHRLLDVLEEGRLADKKYGSTQRGIAPVYADKYRKKSLRVGDLLCPDTLREKLGNIVSWENLLVCAYGHEAIDGGAMYDWLMRCGEPLLDHICDTTVYLAAAADAGKNILFEAQLGALPDIDYGIYPYSTSSSTQAAYAPIGAGIPGHRPESVLGIMKAYSSCVGEGPFVCEFSGEEAEKLREAGGEYGAATGRPRRVGAFDAVASRFGVLVQGATELALTKLDVLSYMEKLPICTGYQVDGTVISDFPTGDRLLRAKPVYEYMDGFRADISGCRRFGELPAEARAYVRALEDAVRCRIGYVSVGAGRDEIIHMNTN
jgi:adenylosuccinate synthase